MIFYFNSLQATQAISTKIQESIYINCNIWFRNANSINMPEIM